MEPLESDIDYMGNEPRPAQPASRFNALLILPIIGAVIVLVFIAAAIFQFDLSDLVDSLIGLLLVLFVALIVMMFWAFAPRANRT